MTVLGIEVEKQPSLVAIEPPRQLCVHCGTPVIQPEEKFCCGGCEFVYRTIHAIGLNGFYRVRTPTDKTRADNVNPHKAYSYLEDPDLIKKMVTLDVHGASSVRFYLPTIHCAACVWLLERLSGVVKGVTESRVSFRSGVIEVRFNPALITVGELARVLNSVGYPPVPATHDAALERDTKEDRSLLRKIGVAAVCAANTMMLADSLFQGSFTGIEEPFLSLLTWASAIISLPAVLYAALPFYRAAWGAVIMGSLHIDIPISIAIVASYGAGILHTLQGDTYVYFDSITSLIFLLLVARYAQRRAIHRARASTVTSWDLFPGTVRVREGDELIEKPFGELVVGAVVEVWPGERIPSDGEVLLGTSLVEASFLTGESLPVAVGPGSMVLGASINIEHKLQVRIEATGEKTRLGKILAGLDQARETRTRLENRVNTFTNTFVIAVLGSTVVTFIAWYWIEPSRAFDIAISLLIVTCPCALGLAIPTAVTVALARAKQNKIFVKNSDAFNSLAEAQHFYFDKTGTLTEGRLSVRAELGSSSVRQLAATLAGAVPVHPVARAIADLAVGPPVVLTNVKHIPGKGIQARLPTGPTITLGSYRWCRERAVTISSDFEKRVGEWETAGGLISVLDEDGVVTAAFQLEDTIRPQAVEIISQLQTQHKKVFILSGDSQAVVNRVADALHIPREDARGDLYPEEKASILLSDRKVSVMIGDGLNDAQAISQSTIGIGVSGGIEATLECADIFVAEKGLSGFWKLYLGACATQRVIKRNLTYSVIYNSIGGGLAMGGYITPLIAAILMPVSSLTVVLSSIMSSYFVDSREK